MLVSGYIALTGVNWSLSMVIQIVSKKLHGKLRLQLRQLIIWSMATAASATNIVSTLPQAKPLAKMTMRKSTHGSPFLLYMSMQLCLAGLEAAEAPLMAILVKVHVLYI